MLGISFRNARRYPYIDMKEICDWLNQAADGRSNWTTDEVRETLRRAGALAHLPEDPGLPSDAIPAKRRCKSTRRRFYTTPELLLTKAGHLHTALLQAMSEEEVSTISGLA